MNDIKWEKLKRTFCTDDTSLVCLALKIVVFCLGLSLFQNVYRLVVMIQLHE